MLRGLLLKYDTCALIALQTQRRNFSISSIKPNEHTFEEIRIDVPWGHLAGKWWGSKEKQPILAVHGWMDNAGTWDKLAEVVSNKYPILAIDLPGCGYSSSIPPLHNYYFTDSPTILRRVQRHFGFKDIVLFGHSGGSASCFLFSTLFPDLVKGYFGVDYLFYMYKNDWLKADKLGNVMDQFLKVANRDPSLVRTYSWKEAKEALIAGSIIGSVTADIVDVLMRRGVQVRPDGTFSFTSDQRLKILKATDMEGFNVEQSRNLVSNLSCHVCLIESTEFPLLQWGVHNDPEFLTLVEKNAKSFSMHKVEGHHHVHVENYKEVAKYAIDFLEKIEV